ncbi:MAG: Mycothiol acetyltransferase [Phycisphaerae bacterium]|nr:Mycothiol acetyltransferase [Phycisphaerae bacterium]
MRQAARQPGRAVFAYPLGGRFKKTVDDDPLPGLGLRPLTLDDGAVLNSFLLSVEEPLSDYTLANTLIWAGPFRPYWAVLRGCFCQFALADGALTVLRPPFGDGDLLGALDDAIDLCRTHNGRVGRPAATCLEYVNEAWLRRFPMPGWRRHPNSGDYLYQTERLISLEGSDLKAKRQARNRFARRYAARTESFTDAHVGPCLAMLETWNEQVRDRAAQQGADPNAKRCDDIIACTSAVRLHGDMGLRGMVLYADDRLVGFTLGESLGRDAFSVLIEKADRDYEGSANYIYSEFCRQYWADRPWCNAGDDWDIENLARVKESYRPAARRFKFTLWPAAPVIVPVSVGPQRGALMDAPQLRPPIATTSDAFGVKPIERIRPAPAPLPTAACPLANREDLDALWQLEHESFNDDDKFNRRQLRYLLACPRASTHLIRNEGEVVASAVLLRRRTRCGLVGRLYSLCVRSAHRGRGYGRLLLNDVIAACRREGIARLRLEVRADNTPAITLYSRAGFVIEELLKDYYAPGADGLKMRLDLRGVLSAKC